MLVKLDLISACTDFLTINIDGRKFRNGFNGDFLCSKKGYAANDAVKIAITQIKNFRFLILSSVASILEMTVN